MVNLLRLQQLVQVTPGSSTSMIHTYLVHRRYNVILDLKLVEKNKAKPSSLNISKAIMTS